MKKIYLVLLIVLITFTTFSQTRVVCNSQKTKSNIIENSSQKLIFSNSLEGFELATAKTKNGIYSQIVVPEYYPDNNIGYPELPIMTKLIEIPENAEIKINIINFDEQIVNLNEYGAEYPIVPNQPSLSKNQDPNLVPFEQNNSIYSDFEYYETELVHIEYSSTMRGIRLAQLTVSPFSYDIESNILTIKNNLVVEITFENADLTKSTQNKLSKYSAAFDAAYHKIWNYKEPANKDALSTYPIKYIIISDRMFETALEPFIEWKTKKGFIVDVQYTDVIGTSRDDIKSYIRGEYEAGTSEDPAPTYLLIVGDVAQVPTFDGSGHKTDMYYCEFDDEGDYIPEMYFGRFSATSVAQLQPQIDKTLMFEQYTFPDPSYLAEVVLVAGEDNTYGPTHANGQINYAHNYYINSEHGITDYTYLYPVSGDPETETEIIADISDGVGFVNYTAHCSSSGWAGPEFETSDIPELANDNEYFFSIGNCCLSNKFEVDECFGEALLRANKGGAVIHLGGSNSTYWDEDFYWSCGISSSINADMTYEGTTQAMYDHLFHENDEDPYFSAGQMNFIGNMSVNNSSSNLKKYYWEIYHVMGDPSLMPYIGVPDEVSASYLSTVPIGMSTLTVTTEENAYVAISLNGVLLDAKLANASGVVTLEFEPLATVATADIVITKQFRAPHIDEIMIIPNENDYDAMLQTINTPSNMVHISNATLAPEFTILNLGQINLTSVTVGYTLNGGEAVEQIWNGNLETLASDIVTFPEITLTAGENTIVAYVNEPNGETDEFPSNDEATKSVLVYAGNAKLTEALSPESILCNTNTFVPQVVLKNLDSYNLTSAIISYECGTVTDEFNWSGTLAENETTTITFPENIFPAGNNSITYNLLDVNNGDNIASNGINISTDFLLIEVGHPYQLDILTDNYGSETTWDLIDNATNNIIYSGGSYPDGATVHHITDLCLGGGCYTFTIYDAFGDGLAPWGGPDGNLSITDMSTSTVIYELAGNNFDTIAYHSFCVEAISCPMDIIIDIVDEPIALTGGLPVNGTYSGTGVTDNTFNPSVAGVGTHTITYSYTFESNNEFSCDFSIEVTNNSGIYNATNEKIEIYPNPTNGILNINFASVQNREIEVVNLTGQIVKQANINSDKIELDLSELAEGTYFVRVKAKASVSITKINVTE